MVAMDIRLLVQVEFEVFGHVQGEKTLAFQYVTQGKMSLFSNQNRLQFHEML